MVNQSKLRRFLDQHYARINVEEACVGTRRDYERPNLDVWVRGKVGYEKLRPEKVQTLWHTHKGTPAQSFCRFISHELFGLDAREYAEIKRGMRRADSLMGIYKNKQSKYYTLVLDIQPQLRDYTKLLVAGGTVAGTLVGGTLIAAGVSRARQKRMKESIGSVSRNPSFIGALDSSGTAGSDSETTVTSSLSSEAGSSESEFDQQQEQEQQEQEQQEQEQQEQQQQEQQEQEQQEPQEQEQQEPQEQQEQQQQEQQQQEQEKQEQQEQDAQQDEDLQEEHEESQEEKYVHQEESEDTPRTAQDIKKQALVEQLEAERVLHQESEPDIFTDIDFYEHEYDVDQCAQQGVTFNTTWLIMYFYKEKILPPELRDGIYLYNTSISYDTLYQFKSRVRQKSFEARSLFKDQLNEFLDQVPADASIGIAVVEMYIVNQAMVVVASHVALLVFDVKNQRLEYYDPNGRDTLYDDIFSHDVDRSFYGYLERNSKDIHYKNSKVCTIWGSPDQLQQDKASCTLWVNVIAICRMSGVDRPFLPTTFDDISAISTAIRQALLNACHFTIFSDLISFNIYNYTRAIDLCQVPEDQIQHLRWLVEKQKNNPARHITGDIEVCKQIAEAPYEDDVKQSPTCDKVTVDTYHVNKDGTKIDESYIEHCGGDIASITYKGSPRLFPHSWFSKTNLIVFEPRSGFVDLNTDLTEVVQAMKSDNTNLTIRFNFGVITFAEVSILDSEQNLNMRIEHVLIHGDVPDGYEEQLDTLRRLSNKQIILLTPDDLEATWERKMSVLQTVKYVAIYEPPGEGVLDKLYIKEVGPFRAEPQIEIPELKQIGMLVFKVSENVEVKHAELPEDEYKEDQEDQEDQEEQEDREDQPQPEQKDDQPQQKQVETEADEEDSEASPQTQQYQKKMAFVSQLEAAEKTARQNRAPELFSHLMFNMDEYDVTKCAQTGVTSETIWIILIFYIEKILPVQLKNGVYLHPASIQYDMLHEFVTRTLKISFEARSLFKDQLNNFIAKVPAGATIGIALVKMKTVDSVDRKLTNHIALLVFDVKNQRLEYYDSNGRDTLYYDTPMEQNIGRSFYGYLIRNSKPIHYSNPKVCVIWGSPDKVQQEKASCSFWATVIAICRMSGVDREHLPTDFDVVNAISHAVRRALLYACQFTVFDGLIAFNRHNWVKAIELCQVPEDQVEQIRGLVESQKNNPPKPITGDIDVCTHLKHTPPPAVMKQAPNCDNVTVDTYLGTPINQSYVDHCQEVGTITFQGNPMLFPDSWFNKTSNIVFEPRSGFVNLNSDLVKVAKAMDTNKQLEIQVKFGIINIAEASILDHSSGLIGRLLVDMVLIHGQFPHNHMQQLQALRALSSVLVVLLSPSDSLETWDLKVSTPVLNIANYVAADEKIKNGPRTDSFIQRFRDFANDKTELNSSEFKQMGMRVFRAV
jgi:flagellar motor protein MotB